ncbi:hypothetical protein [Streptomyces sp. NPDC060001]|uniref:hypothetical protein n=1 Tax=Streptomyces sp. NPDC060001 TaxID=3347032 RepID=UPI0036B53B3D
MSNLIRAPWTAEQVDALNRFQKEGGMHPFTCGHEHPAHPNAILNATPTGWRCFVLDCEYEQDWAHAFMVDPAAWPRPFTDLRRQASGDTCKDVDVDGETIRVRGSGEITIEAQEALGALVRVAKAKFAEESPELDKTRGYLRPVRATMLSDDPDGVHLAVYSWLEMFEAWATGPGLCGESMMQGPLPDGTAVTCQRCEEYRPKYERMLAPGYRKDDDDPDVLRAKLDRIRDEVRLLCECCGNNRDRMVRIRRELGIAEEEWDKTEAERASEDEAGLEEGEGRL